MSKVILNHWLLRKTPYWEFVGFVDVKDYWALQFKDVGVAPLFIFKPNEVWGDSEPTSAKFPWVLLAAGSDDVSYYMLCGSKESAMKYAQHLIDDDGILNVREDAYNGRKWQWHN